MQPHKTTILQVLPKLHQTGGVERGTVEVAAAIETAGMKALVASAEGELCAALKRIGAAHIPCPLDTKNPLKIWLNASKLARIIREHKVDIIHARSRAPAWSAYIASKRTGIPLITTFHGQYNFESNLKKKYNAIMLRGRRVIAVSNFIRQHIVDNYPVDERRIHVVHRGVDLYQFNAARISKQRMVNLLRSWNVPEQLPVILFPGRITRWKGQDVFLRALAKLETKEFFAILVGDDTQHPQYRQELEELITELGLESHVRMVGSSPYMTEAYQLAKFVVATSVEPEAFGRVALEAQAMGKPVIATRHGGACETVRDAETGLLVEPGNPEDLASAMAEILAMDKAQLDHIGQLGQENARNFSTQTMCDKVLGLYRDVLK